MFLAQDVSEPRQCLYTVMRKLEEKVRVSFTKCSKMCVGKLFSLVKPLDTPRVAAMLCQA